MQRSHFTHEVKVDHLYAKVAIGATGAPTLNTAASKGIASISRTSDGLYVLTLAKVYNSLLDFSVIQLFDTLQDLTFQINAIDLSAKTITFWCKATATATDPTDGSTLHIKAILKDSAA